MLKNFPHKKRGVRRPPNFSTLESEGVLQTQFATDIQVFGGEVGARGSSTQLTVDTNGAGQGSTQTNLTAVTGFGSNCISSNDGRTALNIPGSVAVTESTFITQVQISGSASVVVTSPTSVGF